MKPLRTLTAVAALDLVLALSPPAQAVTSDLVVVTLPALPPFAFGFDESVEEPLLLSLAGIPVLPLPELPPHLIVLEEPASEGGGISDMLLLNTTPDSVFCVTQLCFVSDDDS